MTPAQDRRGNPVGTRSAAALDAAEQALWRTMSFYGTPLDDLDAAAQADPAWALPPLMKAGFLLSLTEPALRGDAHALLEQAEARTAHAPERERTHLHALRLLAAGHWQAASLVWDMLLRQHPRDALALQWAHLFDFYRGDARELRDRVARVLPEWPEDDPLQPYVLGLHAFGLEECNQYAQAEAAGRRALAGPAQVPWAIHAVAHVMEMQGRHDEGHAWMVQWRPAWKVGNGFVAHLGWHQALFALESLDAPRVLALFDEHLRADPEQITLQRVDAASMLWRLHLLGIDAGPRWRALLDGWAPQPAQAGHYAFNDLHALLAWLGCGELPAARRWLAEAAARAEAAGGANAAMMAEVGAPLMHGLLAYAEGRDADAIEQLWSARAVAHRFGGSHAQRDLITQTLLAAAARSGDTALGRALLHERRMAKPETPLTRHWAARVGARGDGR